MSRIGRIPVQIPAGVEVKVSADNVVNVKGPKGELSRKIESSDIVVKVEGNEVIVTRKSDESNIKAMHGLYRKLIANMVEGVTKGFEKVLVVNGVGYKVAKEGKSVKLDIGYSHSIVLDVIPGITYDCPSATEISVKGVDKELVGQVAANIKKLRVPDPYHAYGVTLKGEVVARKEGKKGGKKK
jgi:large subunit ribosomal protein L6